MPNYNLIVFAGHLTRDPQLSYTPTQTAVVDFGIAANRTWTGQDGLNREGVCFVDARAFGKTAETINKFFRKGKPILVQGSLTFDQWTGPDGAKRSKHRITVERFVFLPDGQRQSNAAPAGENYKNALPGTVSGPPRNGPLLDDEIPF